MIELNETKPDEFSTGESSAKYVMNLETNGVNITSPDDEKTF